MILPSTFQILVQAIAAELIFVIGYLVLLLSVIACLGIAVLVYEGARWLWFYMMSSAASAHRVPTEITGHARLARNHL